MISNIGMQNQRYAATAAKKTDEDTAKTKAPQEQAAAAVQKKTDSFEKGTDSKPVTYSPNKLNSQQAKQLQDDMDKRTQSFQLMLQKMVVRQGQKSNLSLFGKDLYATPADSMKAAASIADGGEYSVDAVAGRLLDMAKALSGGDPSKIETLRNAVEKGFKAAGVELGGKLPGICQDTYTEVMKRFDDWENESKE